MPWPVWLSWLEHRPVTERLRVQFPVKACIWVAGSIPSLGPNNPRLGCEQKATGRCFSLEWMFLSLLSSLKAMKKMSLGED